ncbi:MAG: TonB-dependent receptor [Ignavibacteria bacterium]|nr:TonB-dependent receptor [Ignavibacteria bacterium]
MKIKSCKIYFTLFVLLLLFQNVLAQKFGQLTGEVTEENGTPLIGANVRVEKTLLGSATTAKGTFRITKVPVGVVTVRISMIGFETKFVENISINLNEETKIDVQLKPTPIETSEIVVTAGKYEQKISEIPVSLNLINSHELSRKNIYEFDDALRYVPGVNVTYDQVSIRGSNGYSRGAGSRVMILFDGIPLFSGDTGEIIFQIIPIHEIERVEIVKGSGSALYGSSAMGGVINIISKETSGNPIYYFKTYAGVYDKPFYDQWNWSERTRMFNGLILSHSRRISDLGLSLSFFRYENDSYRQNNFTKRYSLFLKSKYNISTSENLSFLLNMISYNSGNYVFWRDSRNALIPPVDDIGQTVDAFRFNTHLIHQKAFADDFLLSSKLSLFHNDWRDNTESFNQSKSDMIRSEIQANYLLSENNTLTAGIEANISRVKSNIFSEPIAYGAALFAQDEFKLFKDFKTTIGGRFDFQKVDTLVSEYHFNPKLGFNYSVNEDLFFRASVGRGYRAPSAAELFTTTSVAGINVVPNPKLKSETSWSFECGGNFTLANLVKLDAAIFQSEYYDLIEPGFDYKGEIIFDNITRARIQGAETQLSVNLFNNFWDVNIGYTYLWARDLKEKSFLKYRPRHLMYLNSIWKVDFVELGIDFRYWNRIENIDQEFVQLNIIKDGDLREKVFVTDLHLTFDLIHLGIPVRTYFSVNNLFNYNYVELIGNVAPIRHFVLTLEGIL